MEARESLNNCHFTITIKAEAWISVSDLAEHRVDQVLP